MSSGEDSFVVKLVEAHRGCEWKVRGENASVLLRVV